MRTFTFPLAELAAEAALHVNHSGAVQPPAGTDALLSRLLGLGIAARPSADRTAIRFRARDARAAENVRFSAVCAIVAASYGDEAARWAREATA